MLRFASWDVLSDQEFEYVMCEIKHMPEQLESMNPIVISVFGIITRSLDLILAKEKIT